MSSVASCDLLMFLEDVRCYFYTNDSNEARVLRPGWLGESGLISLFTWSMTCIILQQEFLPVLFVRFMVLYFYFLAKICSSRNELLDVLMHLAFINCLKKFQQYCRFCHCVSEIEFRQIRMMSSIMPSLYASRSSNAHHQMFLTSATVKY